MTSPRLPYSPGYEYVGVVEAVGAGVKTRKVGERVCNLCVWGGNQRYIVEDESQLELVEDDKLSDSVVVSTILSYVTAYQALHRIARLERGEKVFITGASGAVGIAAIQIAHAAGAHVICSASETYHDELKRLGAAECHGRSPDDWKSKVAGQVDVVLDGIW